jgi:hypothetical protein
MACRSDRPESGVGRPASGLRTDTEHTVCQTFSTGFNSGHLGGSGRMAVAPTPEYSLTSTCTEIELEPIFNAD